MQRVAKQWRLEPHDAAAIDRLARQINVSPIVAQLLLNRGVSDPQSARTFLDCPLSGLRPPAELPGAEAAAQRLWSAARDRRRVTVYGDYDVDGVSGTAILYQALRHIGGDVDYYVPNRLDEGYGLNCDAIAQLAAAGTKVIVTVDCGISGAAAAERARELGLELIVTDHHEIQGALPDAVAIVHPRLPGAAPTFDGLSGSGVAFKVAWLLGQLASGGEKVEPRMREFLLDAVGLAALGLVADVVPLIDENRIYVRHGLHRLCTAPPAGIRALMDAAKVSNGNGLRSDDIGFRLAPRLNAAGRLGCARLVVDLLTTPSAERAREIALFLESQNEQRQKLERQMLAEARDQLAGHAEPPAAIVLAGEGWHPGVIGIVAGRLAEQYGRPALVVARTGDTAVGSGRTVPGLALHEALADCSDVLTTHGGHAAAAGFRLQADRIDELRERFTAHVAAKFADGIPPPALRLDAEVPLSALTPGLLAQIDKLEPYGAGNPRPRFLAADLQVVGEPRKIGGGERHLSFRVRQGATNLRGVAWNFAERADELMSDSGRCCVAFTPRLNEWNGRRTVELEAVDFRPGASAVLD